MINCIIVDDEPIARRGLKEYIAREGDMMLVGECETVSHLNLKLKEITPDVIFLDIEMPYCSGMEWLGKREDAPNVIITTAYDQYALQGYDFNVVDYLLKPIPFERFHKAIEKLRTILKRNSAPVSEASASEKHYVVLKTDHCLQQKIYFRDIVYVEVQRNYCRIHLSGTTKEPLLVRTTMNNMITLLPAEQFVQVHRSFLVNAARITERSGYYIKIDDVRIPVSKTFSHSL